MRSCKGSDVRLYSSVFARLWKQFKTDVAQLAESLGMSRSKRSYLFLLCERVGALIARAYCSLETKVAENPVVLSSTNLEIHTLSAGLSYFLENALST